MLGVDPGLAAMGLAVVGRSGGSPVVLWADVVRTPAGLAEALRLRRVYGAVRDAIAEHSPVAVAVERLMWGKNVGSAMSVARASGVVLLAAADAGVGVEEYAPLEVKMAVAGSGEAGKDRVRWALRRVHGVVGVPDQPDAADAVAVALCHQHQARMRSVSREAGRL